MVTDLSASIAPWLLMMMKWFLVLGVLLLYKCLGLSKKGFVFFNQPLGLTTTEAVLLLVFLLHF
jgi:hypothetical protein